MRTPVRRHVAWRCCLLRLSLLLLLLPLLPRLLYLYEVPEINQKNRVRREIRRRSEGERKERAGSSCDINVMEEVR